MPIPRPRGNRIPAAEAATIAPLARISDLWRYKIGIIPVIAACGAVGLVYALLKPLLGI